MTIPKKVGITKLLAIVVVLLFAMSATAFAGGGNPGIDSVIFELDGEYYEVSLSDWADAYYEGAGNEIYDKFAAATVIGIVSGDKYIDFESYADKYFELGDAAEAINAADELDQNIVDQIEKYPPDPNDEDPDLIWKEVANEQQFQAAKNALDRGDINAIKLVGNITLTRQHIIERAWDLRVLDLNGFTINLDEGMLAIRSDNTTVENGTISGDVTWWDWDDVIYAENDWANRPWQNWNDPDSEVLMVSGDSITFDGVNFDVDFADWFQEQNNRTATNLTIKNSALYGVSLFHGIDVTIMDTEVYNRIGIENQDLENGIAPSLIRVDFKENPGPLGVAGSLGICYINNSNATMEYIGWLDNFTGLYVGKSLKYYGEYDETKPTLDNAIIETDKYGLVWWALNHYKAQLTVNGEVCISSYPQNQGPGLMLVGTDSSDYPDLAGDLKGELVDSGDSLQEYFADPANQITDRIEGNRDGGAILGNATFTSPIDAGKDHADVWFGKPTQEFLNENNKHYEGDVYCKYDLCEKSPVSIKGVDYQVSWKDADRLYIGGGLNFDTWVNVFTPSNEYIGCIKKNPDCTSEYDEKPVYEGYIEERAPFVDSVWIGDVHFEKINLWGDFMIEDSKTVTFVDMYLRCDNIRKIYTRDDRQVCLCPEYPPFDHHGTLVGGTIYSDTCEDGVLVFGDGLLVEGVTITDLVRNVILETTRLENVDIYVGEGVINNDRVVCGTELEYAVHIWNGNNATFSNVFWSANTWVEVRDWSRIALEDRIENDGWLKLQKYGVFHIADDAVLNSDVRDHNSYVNIYDQGGYGYITVDYDVVKDSDKWSATWDRWKFNNWKSDAVIKGDFISAKYEFKVTANGEEYKVIRDLRDPANHNNLGYRLLNGVLLTDLLGLSKDHFQLGTDFDIRITVCEDSLNIADNNVKVIDELYVNACWINCCSQRHLCFDYSAPITLRGKTVQIGELDVEFDGKDTEVRPGSEDNEVGFKVKNVGTKKASDTVRLYVDGNLADTAGIAELDIGKTATGTLKYDAPDEPGEVELELRTDYSYATQKVQVMDDEPYVFFDPTITAPSAVGVEEYFDVEWKVENTGTMTGTQEVTWSVLVDYDGEDDPHMLPVMSETVTLDPGETWQAGDYTNFSAADTGTYTFTLTTEDATDEITTIIYDEVPNTVEELEGVLQALGIDGAWNVRIPLAKAADVLGATTDDTLELIIKGKVYDMNYQAANEEFVAFAVQVFTEDEVNAALVRIK